MNVGNIVVTLILIAVVILDIRYLMRNRVNGCSSDCKECHDSCKWSEDLKRARTDIAAGK